MTKGSKWFIINIIISIFPPCQLFLIIYCFYYCAILGQHLIQHCVIIQRDEKGYGLTVTGDNPVYVQSVKEGV